MPKLTEDAKELLADIDEACQAANDDLDGRELTAFSSALHDLITRWRTAWRNGE